MRGFDLLLVYVLSNDKARRWCWNKVKEASIALDQTLKNTTVGKAFFPDNNKKGDTNGNSDGKNNDRNNKTEVVK